MDNRYLSQKLFYGIQEKGQELLKKGRVLLVGCGALGTINAEFLARAGVGYLRLVDGDQVELPNLHRQLLFDESDANGGILKVHAARSRLNEINSEVKIEIVDRNFTEENREELTENIDLIIDCTDNFAARRLIDKAALQKGIPWIYGGVAGALGMVKFVFAGRGESIGELFDSEVSGVNTCRNGVINTAPGIVACIQTTEAIKYLTDNQNNIHDGIIYFDLWNNEWVGGS